MLRILPMQRAHLLFTNKKEGLKQAPRLNPSLTIGTRQQSSLQMEGDWYAFKECKEIDKLRITIYTIARFCTCNNYKPLEKVKCLCSPCRVFHVENEIGAEAVYYSCKKRWISCNHYSLNGYVKVCSGRWTCTCKKQCWSKVFLVSSQMLSSSKRTFSTYLWANFFRKRL